MKKLMNFAASLLLSLSLMAAGCGQSKEAASRKSAPAAAPVATQKVSAAQTSFDLASIPDFSGKPYVVINDNVPSFSDKDKASTSSFEHYSKLDSLGRCGAAFANVSRSTMPTKKRGAIGNIKPSGWHTVKYEGIDGKYLYNRCHLIGYQLTAENANPRNLITGTRYLNVTGMLPFENMVAD